MNLIYNYYEIRQYDAMMNINNSINISKFIKHERYGVNDV